jgi:uncharacterized protein (DUF58 family)
VDDAPFSERTSLDDDEGAELLGSAELAELDRLRRHLALRAATDAQGAIASRRRGQSPEFVDHRGYAPGDDLRRLDWNVLARSDQTVIKRFRAEEESAVRVAVDVSRSMAIGAPSKLLLARRLAAAIAYVSLADGARAQIASFGARGVEIGPAKRGRGQWGAVRRRLEELRADPEREAPKPPDATMTELLSRAGRAGVLVVATDALDPSGDLEAWPRAIARARAAGHDVRFVQILAEEDVDPPWDGDLELVDVESGAAVDVTFDVSARTAYVRRLEALVVALREGCRRAKATYARARSDEPVVALARRLSRGGID